MATIASGAHLTADSGFVRITQVGRVAVRAPYHDPMMGDDYAKGDTILVLDYLGEGFFNAWYRGGMRQVSQYWGEGRRDTSAARLVVAPRGEWWAHITWKAGTQLRRGWLLMRDIDVEGADACE
jgi:hypothetical protein